MLDSFSTDGCRSPIVVLTPEGNASGRIPRFHPLPPPVWAFVNVIVVEIILIINGIVNRNRIRVTVMIWG
jgi:hypothetical protein